MIRLALLYPVLCFVLFGAHLLFHGLGLPVALSVLVPSTLLFVRSVWSPRICGFLLVLAGCEWARTAVDLALARQAAELAWMRAALIIGSCAAITWFAARMLFSRGFDAFYRRIR